MTHKEALEQLMKTALEVMKKDEEKFRKLVKARGLLTAKEDYGEKKKRKDSKNRET